MYEASQGPIIDLAETSPGVFEAADMTASADLALRGSGGGILLAPGQLRFQPIASGRDIALGLGYTRQHSDFLVGRFAEKVEAYTYVDWVDVGLAKPNPSFPTRFMDATENARRIYFNLSGMEGVEEGLKPVEVVDMEPGTMQVTEAELTFILRRQFLQKKSFFFRDGKPVQHPRLKKK